MIRYLVLKFVLAAQKRVFEVNRRARFPRANGSSQSLLSAKRAAPALTETLRFVNGHKDTRGAADRTCDQNDVPIQRDSRQLDEHP
jgi:hypothetical protein